MQQLLIIVLYASFIACNGRWSDIPEIDSSKCDFGKISTPVSGQLYEGIQGALLASRFETLEEFKSVVQLEYFKDDLSRDSNVAANSIVRLKHCNKGVGVVSILESGLSQDDIVKARDGGLIDRLSLLMHSPYAIANRMELNKIYSLARWKSKIFGEGDVAFYDLAKASVNNINTDNLAFKIDRDSSDKGYLNTFNHFTAQAFITTFYSEELADFIADIHELHNMPKLTSGDFTEDELTSQTNNPIDNYVDMINNEWGQEMGKQLKEKYSINQLTYWTPGLLANYLNEIQQYYSWAFQIGFQPFRKEDEVVVRFSNKINVVMKGMPLEWE